MTTIESQIIDILKSLKRKRKYIAVSLWPPFGSTIIESEGNRLYINEGRDGKFEGVSESFYDQVIVKYDSRG